MLARCLLSNSDVQEVRLFYSYARKDAAYRASIDDVLAAFHWDVSVRAWYDGEIRPGAEWEQQIFVNLDAADIVLLFITQAFVDSPYCMQIELPRALDRHRRGEARVIPILLESTEPAWQELPLRHLQALPPGGLPLNHWHSREQAVRETVRALVNEISEPLLAANERTRWKLYLDGNYSSFSIRDEGMVVEELRQRAQDSTLRVRAATTSGSIVMDIESTRHGLVRLRQWFDGAAEPVRRLLEWPVLRVIEWYGAGVQASSAVGLAPPSDAPRAANLQFPTRPGEAACIIGLTIDEDDPLSKLDFFINQGDLPESEQMRNVRSEDLLQDFLTCLATPDSEMWVNLSPNDGAKLLGETLQGTALGRTMLEHDLLLKRLAASLLHPDHEIGRSYWQEVFTQAEQITGHSQHAFDTHPRLWLVPETAVVWQRTSSGQPDDPLPNRTDSELPAWLSEPLPAGSRQAFVVEKAIKVMCEQDYFASRKGLAANPSPIDQICHDAFVEIVLPVVAHEVNHGRAFAAFRQFYGTLILASWVKKEFRSHPLLKRHIDSRNPRRLQPTVKKVTPLHSHDQGVHSSGNRTQTAGAGEGDDEMEPFFQEGIRLRETGELMESKKLLQHALDRRLAQFGEEHYRTHVSMSQLGRTLRALGELERAEQLHRRVLERRRRLYGDADERTVRSMRILADTLSAAHQEGESQRLRADADAFDVMRKPECQHPDNRAFYERYLEIYRNGVFFLRRHEFNPSSGQRITRAYFSGAIDLTGTARILV